MTDEEIVRACAEKVMGWRWHAADYDGLTQEGWYDAARPRWIPDAMEEWNPLTSDADACMMLDRLQSLGWAYDIGSYRHGLKRIQCRFILREIEQGFGEAFAEGVDGAARRRAIVLAALKAVGVDV